MSIRALQVVTHMNRAGLESRLMDIYRHLDRSKVQFDFYTFRLEEGQFDNEIKSLGGKIYYNHPLSIKYLHKNRIEFTEFLCQHPEYKIVHAHMNAWCGILLSAAKRAGVPVRIAHSRTALNKFRLENVAKNIIKLPVNRYATHRFAVSQKAGMWLYGIKAEKQGLIEVWPNALDYGKFRYDPVIRQDIRQANNLNDSLVLMHVGNYVFEKNHAFLLKIFEKTLKMDASAILVLVGGGNWNQVRKEAEHLGIAHNIIFTGLRSDVHHLLQAADVFVFPSLYEGLPGAVLEAQAAGLPCIISNNITSEVCICPFIEQLSLSLGPEQWAEKILTCRGAVRYAPEKYFRESGFEIDSLVQKLTEFYLKVSKNQ